MLEIQEGMPLLLADLWGTQNVVVSLAPSPNNIKKPFPRQKLNHTITTQITLKIKHFLSYVSIRNWPTLNNRNHQ